MRRFALLALLVPAVAAADPAPTRDMKEVCERHTPAPDDFDACGRHYADKYAKDPAAGDEHLFNAGYFFVKAGSVSAALDAWAQLYRQYPKSKIAVKALAMMAHTYANVAMYDKAAERLEEYAMKYAGEKDAYDALSDAIYYRRALGHHDKAIANTKVFVKTFGSKKPRDAAAAHFALTAIYEAQRDSDGARKNLNEYIRMHGARGGVDRLVIAYSRLGLFAWDASCPVKQVDGACVKTVRAKKANTCTGAMTRVEAVKRNDKDVKAALAFFAHAVKQYEKVDGKTDGDEAGARYYYARAKLAQADHEANTHLATAAARTGTAAAWLSDETRLRAKYVARYEAVLAIKDSATSITAAARIGQLLDVMVTSLVASGTTKDECSALATEAEPFRARTLTAYAVCVSKASELGWFDDNGGRLCERALARLEPATYPPLRETVAASHFVSPVTATEPSL